MKERIRHTYHHFALLAVLLLGVALPTHAQVENAKLKQALTGYFQQYSNSAYENTMKYTLQRVVTSEKNQTVEVYASESFGMQPFTPQLVEQITTSVRALLPDPYQNYELTIYANNIDIRQLVTAAWTGTLAEGRHWGKADYKGQPWVQNISQPFRPADGLHGRHLSLWASHGKYYSNGDHAWKWQRPHLYCTTEDLLTQSIAVPFLYPMLERAGAIVFTPRERDWQKHEVVVDNDFPSENGSYQETDGEEEWRVFHSGFTNIHKFLTDFDDPHHEGTARVATTLDRKYEDSERHKMSRAVWTPNVPEDGSYAVYVTYPALFNAVPDAEYVITHGGVETKVLVNQQMGAGTWVYLGHFDFKAGHPESNHITLSNKSDFPGCIAADAVRLGGGMSNVLRADMKRDIIDWQVLPTLTKSQDGELTPTARLDSTGYAMIPGSIIKPDGQIVPPGTGLIQHIDSLFQTTDSTVQILQYTYTNDLIGSGLPRHLEAARYTTQWLGLNRERFGVKDGTYDYGDDINARPIATNYMARGSVYLPGDSGLCVPIEMNLALHSDAGYRKTMDIVGSLAIHTSDFEDGMMPGGQSRMVSRDLCDIMLQQVSSDMKHQYGQWTRRTIYDRNYGETRVPCVPSAILEMFSHQNFADMKRALDPNFKFQLARSIYKGILRFVTLQHAPDGKQTPVVAPLPVRSFSAQADPINHHIRLSWLPTADTLETSGAMPTSYIVYTRTNDTAWDNGRVVNDTHYDFEPQDSLLYHFRVEAANSGGRSMPSETLCARLTRTPNAKEILIVNGFQRLASPQVIYTPDSCGFDMQQDPGVPYIHTPEFAGRQLYFGWDGIGKETEKGMGYSGKELEGMLVKGNTFDYPSLHAQDMMSYDNYNISSCSREALETGAVQAGAYKMMDLIMGSQREDGYSVKSYKTFTPTLQTLLRDFTQKGGSLLVSGAYIGTDMTSAEEQAFTERVLHYSGINSVKAENDILQMEGMNTQMSYLTKPNEQHLSTAYVSALKPDMRSFPTLVYTNTRQAAATAYKGADYACIAVGFPLEQLCEPDVRRNIMQGFLEFLLTK